MRRVSSCVPLRRVAAPRIPLLVCCRAASTDGPRTYYEFLDRFWNRQWLSTTDDVAPVLDTPLFAQALDTLQQTTGMEHAAVLVLFGALCRLATLYFSLCGERASERMRIATCRLRSSHEAFRRVYYREGSSALDIQLAATALKGERRRVFAEERTSNVRCLSSLAGSPVVLLGLYQTSAICESPLLDFGTSSFLWCTSLAMPDPCGLLPLAFCALTLLNFELSLSKEIKNGWMMNIIWGARLGCLCVLPAAASFRAGVCLYFLGMSIAGLLQPLLLRSATFRQWFGFPDKKRLLEAGSNGSGNNDELHTRLEVQFPYLSHLFSPESEENSGLLKDAVDTRASKQYGGDCVSAAGCNDSERRQPRKSHASFTDRPLSRKGTDFASGGWKTARVEFREEDFIPEHHTTDKKGGTEWRG